MLDNTPSTLEYDSQAQVTISNDIFGWDISSLRVQAPASKRPATYSVISDRTKRRKRSLNNKAAVGCHLLARYFTSQLQADRTPEVAIPKPRVYSIVKYSEERLLELFEHLGKECKAFRNLLQASALEAANKIENEFDYVRLTSTYYYFTRLLEGRGKMNASNDTVDFIRAFMGSGSIERFSRNIRAWGRFYYENQCLMVFQRGKHRKLESLIYDEDVAAMYKQWLRTQKPSMRTSHEFNKYLVEEVFPVYGNNANANKYLGRERTARDWLCKLG